MTRVTHPCIFSTESIRAIDPHVADRWRERWGHQAPFGRLRKIFREYHCAELNPYDSRYCPYTEQACAMTFYECAERTVEMAHDEHSAPGYFLSVARTLAMDRADEKPLARTRSSDP